METHETQDQTQAATRDIQKLQEWIESSIQREREALTYVPGGGWRE